MVKKTKLIVFYDSWCPMCTKAKERLERADCNAMIEFETFRNDKIVRKYQLDISQAESRIISIDSVCGVRYEGIYTFREICRRIPGYFAAVPFIQLSILLGLGQTLYDFIARRRTIIPAGACHDQQCKVHQHTKPISDEEDGN